MTDQESSYWHHAPPHVFIPDSTYFITAGTVDRAHLFNTSEKRDSLVAQFAADVERAAWQLHAWVFFANHYHFVAFAPEGALPMKRLLQAFHSNSARALNTVDGTPGRKVWHQYRDTRLTFERSYLARMRYVLENPVKHGLVKVSEEYRWGSMRWFLKEGNPGFQKTVLSFNIDRISIDDDY
ncbi:MAG: hypothetical protein AMXMBFR84_03280 [Candidatus Hydrogenedentota bacterium]